ncbi:peptidase inhibitor family I36 protein [Spirosoma endophyticum]|uniref:Uncharacterized protein n=1 Tax=Spirosoma endophyticum TaxID=662367 RepID=A0A1I2HRD1_9BACT|nr:peptidase inhibitor family I36 protein [Spirosoma endophyticum]SFF32098.1 hypothetical protein SAMN05216167_1472 [Spirosoma endophyticum]
MDISTDRLLIGQGFLSVTGEEGGNSVIFLNDDDLTTAGDGNGQTVRFTLEQLDSFEKLKQKLNISVAASLGFGIWSADLAVDFMKSGTFTQHNSFLVLDVVVTNPAKVLKKSKMTRAALMRASLGEADFLDFCGNSFVYGRQTGGQLTAVVQFSSTYKEEYEEVKARINGAVGGYGKGSLSLDQAMSSISTSTHTKIEILRKGTSDVIPGITELINVAKEFPARIAPGSGNSAIVNMLTRGYNTVDNFPSRKIDLNILDQQARTIETVASYLDRGYEVKGDLLFLINNPDLFDYPGDLKANATAAFQQNEDIILSLRDKITEIRQNPRTVAPPPPSFSSLSVVRKNKAIPPPPPPPPPPPKPPILILFEDRGYGGRKIETNNSIADLRNLNFNDKLTSYVVNGDPHEYTIQFFANINFDGKLIEVDSPSSDDDMSRIFRSDIVSSVNIIKN